MSTLICWTNTDNQMTEVSAATPLPVTGTFVVDSEFPAAALITDNFANPTTTNVMAMGMLWDGAAWDRTPGNSTDGVLVNLGANNDVTVTGSLTTVTTVTAVTAITNALPAGTNNIGDIDVLTLPGVAGDVAHDSADSGNPLKVGGKGLTAPVTAVTANDRVNAFFDTWGAQIVSEGLREMKASQITTITSSTAETTIVTADATYKQDMYGIIVVNTSATATEISVKDSTAGTTRFWISVPANDMRGFMLPMSAAHNQNAVNQNWTATCADSVASVIITALTIKHL